MGPDYTERQTPAGATHTGGSAAPVARRPLLRPSLQVVRDTLGNEALGRQIDQVAAQVKTGRPLAEPLEQSGMFPPLLVQITAMGEQTGRLDELLLSAAETFDETADTVMNRFLALFPAILILLLACAIFFIIVATLLPIVGMDLSIL